MGFTHLAQLVRDVDAKVQGDRKAYTEEMLPRVLTMCSHIEVAIEEARLQDAARTRYARAARAAQATQPSLEARPPAREDAQQQQVPPSRFVFAVDVLAHFGHLQYSLPAKHWLRLWREKNKAGPVIDLDALQVMVNAEYSKDYSQRVQELHETLKTRMRPHDRLAYFLDNSRVVASTKWKTSCTRRNVKHAAADRCISAKQQLITIATTPGLSRSQRAKRSQPWLNVIWRKGWAISTLQINTPAGVQRLAEVPLADDPASLTTRQQVAAAYLETNGDLVRLGLPTEQPPERLPFFLDCIDAADVSMYRFCAAMSFRYVVLALTIDSDFNMVPRPSEIRYTVGYRQKAPVRKPWALTNNESFHRYPSGVPRRTVEEARKAGALSGQDYVVGGAAGIGYGRLMRNKQLLSGTLDDTLAQLHRLSVAHRAPRIWEKAHASLRDRMDEFQAALQVFTTYHHSSSILIEDLAHVPLAPPPVFLAESATAAGLARIIAPFSMKRQDARLPAEREAQRDSPEVTAAAARSASRNPMRMHNQTLHNGRHHHSVFSNILLEVPERTREAIPPARSYAPADINADRLPRPDDHPALSEWPVLLEGIKGVDVQAAAARKARKAQARVARKAQLAAEGAATEDDEGEEQEDEEDNEEDGDGDQSGDLQEAEAEGAVAEQEQADAQELASAEAMDDGAPKLTDFVGGLYSVYTTEGSLQSLLRTLSEDEIDERPLVPYLQLAVLTSRCKIAVLNEFGGIYFGMLSEKATLVHLGAYRFSQSAQALKAPLLVAMKLLKRQPQGGSTPMTHEQREKLLDTWAPLYAYHDSPPAVTDCRQQLLALESKLYSMQKRKES